MTSPDFGPDSELYWLGMEIAAEDDETRAAADRFFADMEATDWLKDPLIIDIPPEVCEFLKSRGMTDEQITKYANEVLEKYVAEKTAADPGPGEDDPR